MKKSFVHLFVAFSMLAINASVLVLTSPAQAAMLHNSPHMRSVSHVIHRASASSNCDLDTPDANGTWPCSVASTVHSCLWEVASPSLQGHGIQCYPAGATLHIECQVYGDMVNDNNVWDYVTENGGGYVADYFMSTSSKHGNLSPNIPLC